MLVQQRCSCTSRLFSKQNTPTSPHAPTPTLRQGNVQGSVEVSGREGVGAYHKCSLVSYAGGQACRYPWGASRGGGDVHRARILVFSTNSVSSQMAQFPFVFIKIINTSPANHQQRTIPQVSEQSTTINIQMQYTARTENPLL